MRPSAADVKGLPSSRPEVDSPAAFRREVEARCIPRGQIGGCDQCASGQFDVGRNTSCMESEVPTQDHRIESPAMNSLISVGFEDWDQIEPILEIAAPPAASQLPGNHPAREHPGRPDLCLRKRVGGLFSSFCCGPDAEVPTSFLRGRREVLSKARAGCEQKKQAHDLKENCRRRGLWFAKGWRIDEGGGLHAGDRKNR